ncbi:uncharacterized protein LOC132268571 [Cornus florida]|uniref:uncharacterized protein LOC132268571 n=1 Tax=Cornus florida TaxID=4283 RepID=UPI0028982AEC|nr:uncharacterized protein LOC132268571 [Cornus florida]
MLGFTTAALHPPIPIPIPPIPTPLHILPPKLIFFPPLPLKTLTQKSPRNLGKFVISAENGNGLSNDPKEEERDEDGNNNNGGGEDVKRDQRPRFNLRWVDLLVDPDPDNILAVGLTGLLTWASVQVLWQLLFISLAIVVAALKYSFIAALLIFILIALL